MLTGVKARTDPQVAYPATKQKAKAAAVASRAGYEEWKKAKCLEVCTKTGAVASITWGREDEGARAPLSPGSAVRRRHAIHYLFVEVFGTPDEEDWAAPNFHLRLSLSRVIMDMLNIPATSKAAVITAMKAIADAHQAKKEYDHHSGARRLGSDRGLHAPGRGGVQRDGEWHEPGQHGGGVEPVAPNQGIGAHQLWVACSAS